MLLRVAVHFLITHGSRADADRLTIVSQGECIGNLEVMLNLFMQCTHHQRMRVPSPFFHDVCEALQQTRERGRRHGK